MQLSLCLISSIFQTLRFQLHHLCIFFLLLMFHTFYDNRCISLGFIVHWISSIMNFNLSINRNYCVCYFIPLTKCHQSWCHDRKCQQDPAVPTQNWSRAYYSVHILCNWRVQPPLVMIWNASGTWAYLSKIWFWVHYNGPEQVK